MTTPASADIRVRVLAYSPDRLLPIQSVSRTELAAIREWATVLWVHIDEPAAHNSLLAIADDFGLHPLAIHDAINPDQRGKTEIFRNHSLTVCNLIETAQNQAGEYTSDNVSLFLGKNFLITTQFTPEDCLARLRDTLEDPGTKLRQRGPDFLAAVILEHIITAMLPIIEKLGDELSDLEDSVIASPGNATIHMLHARKRTLLKLRRALAPYRESIPALMSEENPYVTEEHVKYFRDAYDRAVLAIDLVETYRAMASDLTDLQINSVNHRMNEIMKVLTLISVVFIPLTFIVGVYGMNFDPSAGPLSMPELNWPNGYLIIWGVMLLVATFQLILFWRKGWFQNGR